MVAILNSILDGSIAVQPIDLTWGVAVQLYHLVFTIKPPQLEVKTWRQFYAVLGTLTTGGPVQIPDPTKDRLKRPMERKNSPRGLYPELN